MKSIKTLLKWSLILLALTPAIYGEATLTPSQNAKTLFLRFFIAISSVFFFILCASLREFREEVKARLIILWKHPLFKITTVLYSILAVSTIFAYHHFIGFLGEVEREEGFMGLTFFYSFFFYASILFKKKDWNWFYGLLMFTQLPIIIFAFGQFSEGSARANSILGNPIYFASYAVCMLFISSVMYLKAKQENKSAAKFFSICSIIIAILGLFMANTRSAMLGVIVATAIGIVYAFIYSDSVFPQIAKKKVRNTAIALFASFVIFAGVFISTRNAQIWTHIPGLNRLSNTTIGDSTTKARLVSWNIALHSISPVHAGVGRMLIGYGWDNYFFAWQKFYNPDLYEYDVATFDRPHNKILDMLVMTGVLGFLAYLAMWFFFIKIVFKHRFKDGKFALLCIFWAVAYFIQNLFAFDSIISWIISFAIFAYVINETSHEDTEVKSHKNKNIEDTKGNAVLIASSSVVAIFLSTCFILWTYIPYRQMTIWKSDVTAFLAGDDSRFPQDPFVYKNYNESTQLNIRFASFSNLFNQYVNAKREGYTPLYDIALANEKEWVDAHPYRYDNLMSVAKGYEFKANLTKDNSWYDKADEYYLKAIALCPERQDLLYTYAEHLSNIGRKPEALALLQKMIKQNPNIAQTRYYTGLVLAAGNTNNFDEALSTLEASFDTGRVGGDPITVKAVYEHFFVHYYETGDIKNFRTVVRRLIWVDGTQSETYRTISDYVDKYHSIPKLNIHD